MYFILLETFISYRRNTTQELKLSLLPCRWVYCLTHQGSPYKTSVQFSSVAQSCPTLCNPMNRSTPGLPVHHRLRVHPNLEIYKWQYPPSLLLSCSTIWGLNHLWSWAVSRSSLLSSTVRPLDSYLISLCPMSISEDIYW